MKAYVLAAGYATRMYPLTRDVPKALLEVSGEPILTHIMRRVREIEGIDEVVVVTNARFFAQFEAWREAQEPWAPIIVLNDGSTANDHRLGAIGDLRFALERVPLDGQAALVLASDNLVDADLTEAARVFRERARTTLIVRRVEHDGGPSPYNEVTLGPDGRVIGFREKPADPATGLSAIAVYFFPPEDLSRLDEYLAAGNPDAPGHFVAWLVSRAECFAAPLRGDWYDIGSLESLAEARAQYGNDA